MQNVFFIVTLFFSQSVLAEHDHEFQKGDKYRVLKEISLPENHRAVIMVHEGGHILGQPFQVELRVACQGQDKIENFVVRDSFSTCDLSPDSIRINNQKTAMALKVKNADITFYNQQISNGIPSPVLRCARATQVKKFSLRDLCS